MTSAFQTSRIWRHFFHHRWFYVAAALGIVAGLVTDMIAPKLAFFVAGDTFYLSYLI